MEGREIIALGSALYNYKASNQDELTLLQGDVVFIYSKDPEIVGDDGWWLGGVGERVGVFPANYVLEDTDEDSASRRNSTIPDPPQQPSHQQAAQQQTPPPPQTPPPQTPPGSQADAAQRAQWLDSTVGPSIEQSSSIGLSWETDPSPAMLVVPLEPPQTQAPTGPTRKSEALVQRAKKLSLKRESMTSAPAILKEIPYSDLTMIKPIGRGGFGLVYLASYAGMEVAAKLIESSDFSEADLLRKSQELRAEGELLAGCAHRNVARLLGACTAAPHFLLVMEFARGGALSKALPLAKLSPSVIIDWTTQIACGMNYLHNEGPVSVVHCDLKSANVLLSLVHEDGSPQLEKNVLKITDFGLARKFTQTTKLSLTAGTFQWMAPEVIKSNIFSKRSDVWSFGVVVWELITRHAPYEGLHPMSVAYSVALHGSTLPVPHACPEPFASLMTRCWLHEPQSRPSFQDILLKLRSAKVSSFGEAPYDQVQNEWKSEIALKFQELSRTEQEMTEQFHAVKKLQQEQLAKQEKLDRQTRELEAKERELAAREQALLSLASQSEVAPIPVVVPRGPGPLDRKKKALTFEISEPTNFRHVNHISPIANSSQTLAEMVQAISKAGVDVSLSPVPVPAHRQHAHASINRSQSALASSTEFSPPHAPHPPRRSDTGHLLSYERGLSSPLHSTERSAQSPTSPQLRGSSPLAISKSNTTPARPLSAISSSGASPAARAESCSPSTSPSKLASLDSNPPQLSPLAKKEGNVIRAWSFNALLDKLASSTSKGSKSKLAASPQPTTPTIDRLQSHELPWTCVACNNVNPPTGDRCARCDIPAPPSVMPDVPPRLNAPSRSFDLALPAASTNPFLMPEPLPRDSDLDVMNRLDVMHIATRHRALSESASTAGSHGPTPSSPAQARSWSHQWLQLHLGKQQANQYILDEPDGVFVIRRSHSSQGGYAIAVIQVLPTQRRIWHGIIDVTATGLLHFRGQDDTQFLNLDEFVSYYTMHPYVVVDDRPFFLSLKFRSSVI
eukprot:m.548184 g.548184  ORF g.548184 m.548184 type:complete len:1017 (-) comp57716_c0_seq2:1606-4656(-)